MQITNVKLTELKTYDKNARTHPKKQVDLLVENIKRFGFTTPILINEQNEVIAGHGRILALTQMGETEAPCVKMEGLSDEEVKALRLADNQIAQMSDWDMTLVIEELKGLTPEMLDLTGFDKDLIIEADEKDDEVPEIPEEPKSKLGDLYELGQHRVLCGDSTKVDDVERLMDGKKADMVFTDPPYELDTRGGGVLKDAKSMRGIEELGIGHFDPFTLESRAKTEVFCCNKPLVKTYLELAELWGKSYDICFYKKENTAPNYGGHMMTDTEYLILIGLQSPNKGLPKETYSKAFIGKKDLDNKTAWSKPIGLIEKFVILYSKVNEIVLDLFLGSGSTLIASEKTGRICYGCELDERYCDVIVQRYVDYTGIEEVKKNGIIEIWKKSQKAV
jgi:DNA modification methylase